METTVPLPYSQMVNRLTLGFRSEWSTFRGLFILWIILVFFHHKGRRTAASLANVTIYKVSVNVPFPSKLTLSAVVG